MAILANEDVGRVLRPAICDILSLLESFENDFDNIFSCKKMNCCHLLCGMSSTNSISPADPCHFI